MTSNIKLTKKRMVQIIFLVILVLAIRDSINEPDSFIQGFNFVLNIFN